MAKVVEEVEGAVVVVLVVVPVVEVLGAVEAVLTDTVAQAECEANLIISPTNLLTDFCYQ